ncbi:MAG: hypothetical protein K0Q74_1136, partial [Gammaproteobacteria bacterium]|nr:hypothetical protein [Gammaproteobacteria bacterium]
MTEETRNPQQTTQKRKRSPLSSQILAERAATPLPIDSPDRIEWEKLAAKHDAARTDKTKEKLTADERKRLDELKTQYKAWIRSDNDESTEYGATDSATKKRQTTETEKQASAAEAIPQGLTAEKTLAKIRERVAEHDATIAANQQGREKLSSTTQAPLKKGFNNLLKYPAKFPISVEARAAVREYQKWARNLNTAYAKKDPALIELAEEELARRRENLNNFLEPTAFRSFMSKFGAFLPDELVFFMSYWPKLAILGFISAMAITGAGWMVGGAVLAPIAALVAFRKEIHNGLVTFLYSLGKGNKDSRWTKIAEALENARFSTLVIGGLSISIVAYGAALMGPVGLIALPFVFATGLALRSLTDMIYEFIMTGESQTFNKITSFIGKHPIAFGASLFASMGVLAGTYSFLGAGFQAIVPALYAGLSSTAMAAITQVNSFIVGTLSSVIPSSGVASVLASPFTMFTGFITGLAGSVGGVIPALAITGIMAVGINLLLDKIADTAGLKGTGRTVFKFFGAVGTIVIAAGLMAAGGFLAIGIGLGLLAAIGFAIKIIDSRASHKAAKLLTQTANKTTFTNEEALGLIKRFAEGPTAQVTATAENEQSQKAKMSETKEAIATKAETANNATQFVNALEAKGVDLTAFYIQSHNILKDPNSSPESRIMAAEVIRVITERHPATDTYMNWEDSRIAELELGPVSLLAHDRDGQKISRAKQVVSALKEKHLALGDRLVE